MVIFHWSLFDGKMVGYKEKTVNITEYENIYLDIRNDDYSVNPNIGEILKKLGNEK